MTDGDALQEAADRRLNPFPGIRPYQPDESHLFFGRDEHVHELLRTMRRNRFVAVLGNSGTGKSSIVRAGVLPPLESGFMVPEAGLWRMAIMQPGRSDPIRALADAISSDKKRGWGLGKSRDEVLRELRRGGLGLINVAQQAPVRPGSRFLILVDQFEELFGFMDAPGDFRGSDEARAFIRLLIEATTNSSLPIYVVMTMRSEFLGHCAALPGLTEIINRSLYLVPELTRDQLRQVIEGPVHWSEPLRVDNESWLD